MFSILRICAFAVALSPSLLATTQSDTEQEPELDPFATLEVRLVSDETGVALVGHSVAVSKHGLWMYDKPLDKSRGGLRECVQTDENGLVTFSVPPGTALHVMYAQRGHEDIAFKQESPLSKGQIKRLTIRVLTRQELTVTGRVTARETKSPIAGARVRACTCAFTSDKDGEDLELEEVIREVLTDSEGRFTLSVPTLDASYARVTAPGFGERRIQLGGRESSEDVSFEIALPPSASLQIVIQDAEGKAVRDLTPRLRAHSYPLQSPEYTFKYYVAEAAWTVPSSPVDHHFFFDDLPADAPLAIDLLRDGKRLRTEPRRLSLSEGEQRELVLRIGTGAEIVGTLANAEGKPIPYKEIWIMPAPLDEKTIREFQPFETTWSRAITDLEGAFQFSDVPPDSWWIGPRPLRAIAWSTAGLHLALCQLSSSSRVAAIPIPFS